MPKTMTMNMSLRRLHDMSLRNVAKFFKQATAFDVQRFTVPCTEAPHGLEGVVCCFLCMGIAPGRKLAPLPDTRCVCVGGAL